MSMEYAEKPFIVRQTYYNSDRVNHSFLFEDEGSAMRKFSELHDRCPRDRIQVEDLRRGIVIADTKPQRRKRRR